MAKTTAKKQEVDVNAILNGALVQTDAKGAKSKIPVLTVSEEIKALVAKEKDLATKIEALQTQEEVVKNDLITKVTPIYEGMCAGSYVSSVKVPSTDATTILMSWKSQYSKIAPTEKGTIQGVVGEENFKRWFNVENTITVKDTTNEKLAELMKLVGPERFREFFEVTQNIVPNVMFTEEKYRTLNAEQRAALAPVVKQYKPSVRAK